MNRAEKATIVEQLSDKLGRANIAILADYRGLTVAEFEELRIALRKCESEVRVSKNTLLRRAVDGTDYAPIADSWQGTTALTLAYDDPVGATKVMVDFAKDHDKLVIKTAVLEGKVLTNDDLAALSKLPSKDVLRAKLLSVMQAVPTNFVQVLNAIPQQVVYLLQAIKDQKEQADN